MVLIFQHIKIQKLSTIPDYWGITVLEMAKFVRHCWEVDGCFSSEQLEKNAIQIYGMDDAKSITRLKIYIKHIMLHKTFGYKGVFVREHLIDKDVIDILGIRCEYPTLVLRLLSDGRVDDGHHRVPIYYAMGIRRMPVAIVTAVRGNWHDYKDQYVRDLRIGLVDFFNSQEWEDYKTTEDYTLLNAEGIK